MSQIPSSRRPLIGITGYVEDAIWGQWSVPAALAPLAYVPAIAQAGGRALSASAASPVGP